MLRWRCAKSRLFKFMSLFYSFFWSYIQGVPAFPDFWSQRVIMKCGDHEFWGLFLAREKRNHNFLTKSSCKTFLGTNFIRVLRQWCTEKKGGWWYNLMPIVHCRRNGSNLFQITADAHPGVSGVSKHQKFCEELKNTNCQVDHPAKIE